MQETWRWFGPEDQVSLGDVLQAGASGIVSALHHLQAGELWSDQEIGDRIRQIGSTGGLKWAVVESLPVSDDIKRQSGDWRSHIETYKDSLTNLAGAGLETICYNFMPLLDWTRTDLGHTLANQATCMRFDFTDFAMFDIHLLGRAGAAEDFPPGLIEKAAKRFKESSDARRTAIINNVISGLPGSTESYSLLDLRTELQTYQAIGPERIRQNLYDFLEMVAPHAEQLGLRLCCHPDDPPYPLLGLPRIMSTQEDYSRLIGAVDLPANGITLCSGSLSALKSNDVAGMMRRMGDRVHFLHLRNVQREHEDEFGSFHESEHFGGDLDMAELISVVLKEEASRRAAGRQDHSIPFRPDHGQSILDDLTRPTLPGYPAIGRLKGLAELRGAIAGLSYARQKELKLDGDLGQRT